jgi:hypothetical protein
MKNILKVIGIAIFLTFANSTSAQFSITNQNGTVAVAGYAAGGVPASTATYGTLVLNTPAYVTYTYLGSTASWLDSFSTAGHTFYDGAASYAPGGYTPTKIGANFTTYTSAGTLNFNFATLNYTVGSATNGLSYSSKSTPSFAISSNEVVNGVSYQYVLDYKDTYGGAKDYTNMFIGVNDPPGEPPAGAPEINGSLTPKVGFLLGCLFLMFGRRGKSSDHPENLPFIGSTTS